MLQIIIISTKEAQEWNKIEQNKSHLSFVYNAK